MSIQVVLFDLDGTLLPMDQDVFVKAYFKGLATRLAPLGYEPEQLVKGIWTGTEAMVCNKGSKTNEEIFWETFAKVYGPKVLEDEPYFDEYYRTEFQKVKEVCGFAPQAAEIVHGLQEKSVRVVLATNPIFPAVATQSRIRWAGLTPEDFEFYTTYENSRFCKPNLNYYKEIVERLGVSAEECLMVGNDVGEDMVAEKLGMKVFLLTDCLINKEQADIDAYPHGGFEELKRYFSVVLEKC